MVKIEEERAGFDEAGIRLVPIVMNSAAQVSPELGRFGLTTPYSIDRGGIVSRAYDTLGKGHHAELPGHSFVLIGADGNQLWRGRLPVDVGRALRAAGGGQVRALMDTRFAALSWRVDTHRELFGIPFFPHGLLIAVGFVVGWRIFSHYGRRVGLPSSTALDLVTTIALGSLVRDPAALGSRQLVGGRLDR